MKINHMKKIGVILVYEPLKYSNTFGFGYEYLGIPNSVSTVFNQRQQFEPVQSPGAYLVS